MDEQHFQTAGASAEQQQARALLLHCRYFSSLTRRISA